MHRHLGPGLLESIYVEALCVEFGLRSIPYERKKPLDVFYKEHRIKGQEVDLMVFGEVIVEVKSTRQNHEVFLAQVLSYLKSSGLKRGLLMNFGLVRLIDGIQRVSL